LQEFVRLKDIKDIEYHLITRGFVQKYTCWSKHGELLVDNSTSVRTSTDNENRDSYINDDCGNSNEMSDNVEDAIGDNDQENLQTVLEDSQKPLYASYIKFSVLSGVLKLFGVKTKHRWTDASFTDLLEVVHEMLLDGPKQPSNDIYVYLAPLIDDLKTLWNKGVKVYDAYKKENFTLRAMIFCTISDFPAYENLSGYSTKGKFACPVCEDQTSSSWLRNCKKAIFMGHRRSLVRNHPYRKKKREFDGTIEYGTVRTRFDAKDALSRVQNESSTTRGSIVAGYLVEELIEFGNDVVKGVENIGIPHSRYKENLGQPNVDKTVERLREGPRCVVRSYQGYDINGYTFYTEMQDEKSTMQNSGVTVIASTMKFDRNEKGFTLVDLSTDSYTSDPFILAKLATQVFYVKDPSKSRWHIVLHGKRSILGVENVVDKDEYDQVDELPPFCDGVPPSVDSHVYGLLDALALLSLGVSFESCTLFSFLKVFPIGFFLRRFFKEAVLFELLISYPPLFVVAGLD
nr:hypothetical protein [Tanacetum cinerariifolium]